MVCVVCDRVCSCLWYIVETKCPHKESKTTSFHGKKIVKILNDGLSESVKIHTGFL